MMQVSPAKPTDPDVKFNVSGATLKNKPYTSQPPEGTTYYYPDLSEQVIKNKEWTGDGKDMVCLYFYLAHKTPEAAVEHLKAINGSTFFKKMD